MKNVLKELVKNLNFIFVSVYLIVALSLLSLVNLILTNKYVLIVRYLVLSFILIKGILGYKEYLKNKDKVYEVDKRYVMFFEKEYLKGKWHFIWYIIDTLVLIIFLGLPNSFGSFFLWILFLISIPLLVIRKCILKREYSSLNIKEVNIENARISNKERFFNLVKYVLFYLVITCLVTYLFCKLNNAFNSWYMVALLFLILFILKIIMNNPLNEYFDLKKKMFTVKVYNIFIFIIMVLVIYIGMIVGVYKLRPYIDSVQKVGSKEHKIVFEDNMYKIYKGKDDFKILQLSDIHIGGSTVSYNKDIKALDAIQKLVNYTKPDLIIITGDLIYPTPIQSFYLNNQTAMFQLVYFFNKLEIPWTFVYGNHETEVYALRNATDLYNMVLSSASNMFNKNNYLLFYNSDNNIHGRSNMIFEIINRDKSINQILFLMDSGDYYSRKLNDYDYIRDDQVKWYSDNLKKIGTYNSSMIFFHMPLRETEEAIRLYENNSDEVTYYFGEAKEKVCDSRFSSKLFEEAVSLGSTKAMFYGHDHKNNISLGYKGIRLTYGMSIDYIATPGIENEIDQRGATLITLKDKSKFDVEQVKLKDID